MVLSGFVLSLIAKGEYIWSHVCHTLIKELSDHKNDCVHIYETNELVYIIHNVIILIGIGVIPLHVKCTSFSKMIHFIENAYNKVLVELKLHGFLETFFPLQTSPLFILDGLKTRRM